jgi:hypothetical protein
MKNGLAEDIRGKRGAVGNSAYEEEGMGKLFWLSGFTRLVQLV